MKHQIEFQDGIIYGSIIHFQEILIQLKLINVIFFKMLGIESLFHNNINIKHIATNQLILILLLE